MLAAEIQQMHPLDIRERRFRLQQQAGKLDDGPEKEAIEAQIAAIQEACPHISEEEGEQGWRCRDCDLTRDPEPDPEEEAAANDGDEPDEAS